MRDPLSPSLPSRVPGRGRLLASLRALLRRVQRFNAFRATSDEQRWAARFADDLEAAYVTALSAPGARAGLEAVDRRAAIRRKKPAAGQLQATVISETSTLIRPDVGPIVRRPS